MIMKLIKWSIGVYLCSNISKNIKYLRIVAIILLSSSDSSEVSESEFEWSEWWSSESILEI